MTTRNRLIAVIAAAAASFVVAAQPAYAAAGDLTFKECAAGNPTCAIQLPGRPLNGAQSVAISPDNRNAYVASSVSDTLSIFSLGAGGKMTFLDCLANGAAPGSTCTVLPEKPLGDVRNVAVSPDGLSVFVVGRDSGTVSTFNRSATTGKLEFVGCFSNDNPKCTAVPAAPLRGITGLAVSPGGGSVYVTSSTSILRFVTIGEKLLSYLDCQANDDSEGCVALPKPLLR